MYLLMHKSLCCTKWKTAEGRQTEGRRDLKSAPSKDRTNKHCCQMQIQRDNWPSASQRFSQARPKSTNVADSPPSADRNSVEKLERLGRRGSVEAANGRGLGGGREEE